MGPYLILDKLGQGGLSQVFKARHAETDWVVALKVIRPEAMADEEGRQQFLREMEAMARLEHPNIVQFCDLDQAGELFYFAMEFVEGTDLGKHVGLSGPLAVGEACDYIRQASLGLQHAHERNLVHRDIKPVNLFLTYLPAPVTGEGRTSKKSKQVRQPLIKILDWGLASLHYPKGQSNPELLQTMASGIVGTADYLSPEQARNHQTVDIRGDIYSLGCTFYFLLTGQAPFPTGTLMQKILQHQQGEPCPVESFREDVPADILGILKRMLAKDPEKRFQTPAAVALALAPFGAMRVLAWTRSAASSSLSRMPVPNATRGIHPCPAASASRGASPRRAGIAALAGKQTPLVHDRNVGLEPFHGGLQGAALIVVKCFVK